MDDDGNKKLDIREFKKGLRDYGVDIDPDEVQEMFDAFDKDHSGSIDFDEFLVRLRVHLLYFCSLFIFIDIITVY